MNTKLSLTLALVLLFTAANAQQDGKKAVPPQQKKSLTPVQSAPVAKNPNVTIGTTIPAGKRIYESVPNDPFNARIYTLGNGMKVYISVNKDAPRIQTLLAVKAGSKFDPAQTTGLAHYLEHMMFKGTEQMGTKDWAKEKVLLDSVQAYFEYHKNEKDEAKKTALYAKIDSFSYEASKFAIPNENDKMTTSIGAQGTNAFTSTD